MAILKPDKAATLGSVTVNEYLLTKHNPNRIIMLSASMEGKIIGVTIHNTSWITTTPGTTPAEQYTRATVNGNMNDVRVHYYVDNTCAWQNLPLTLSGWYAADGSGNGNRRTIAIECIMSSVYNYTDKKSEGNAAKLAAALLKKYNLSIDHIYTHTHWLNVRDGKSGSVDYLNTAKNSYKTCPLYILLHWSAFKAKVQSYMNFGTSKSTTQLYRVRKSWSDAKSQIGAFASLENAKKACKSGYFVFNANAINTVKSYCQRNQLGGRKSTDSNKHFCKQCGIEVKQTPHRKLKKFCSDKCRMKWWNRHPEKLHRKSGKNIVCPICTGGKSVCQ